jgi:hypothetical protein
MRYAVALALVLVLAVSDFVVRPGLAPADDGEELRALEAAAPARLLPLDEEFVGPLTGWADLKTRYGAAGDGVADDSAAWQRALDELGTEQRSPVLYVPAGTYRITQTLRLSQRLYVSILGEDPDRTVVRWDGAKGGAMLHLNGVSYSRVGRLTWDGSGKASTAVEHGWDGKGPIASTGNEHADEVFVDVGAGIRAGTLGYMDAETTVLRCEFRRNNQAGVSIQTWNALNWFIRDSRFEDNYYGVTNLYGAGNFHVYGSVFYNSTGADVAIRNTGYFSLRNNTSVHSNMFFSAGPVGSSSALVTIQGNTIVDPQSMPIRVSNPGPLILLDNVVRSRVRRGGPVVWVRQPFTARRTADVLSVGNTFTVPHALDVWGDVITVDDNVVAPDALQPSRPALPARPQHVARPVLEVPPGAGADAIQQVLDGSIALNGQRPLVHLPAGTYQIDQTLVVPAGSDVQVVGDGGRTVLSWSGPGDGPVLRLAGPTRASLRDLKISGAGRADGIVLDDADQQDARVFIEQGFFEGSTVGLLVDRLSRTDVSLNAVGLSRNALGVEVVGDAGAPTSQARSGRVNVFGGAAGGNQLTYSVSDGGRLLVRDHWYEGDAPGFVRLRGAGTFTLHGAVVAASDPNHGGKDQSDAYSIQIDDFRGDVSVLATQLGIYNRMRVQAQDNDINALGLGMVGIDKGYFINRSATGRVALLVSRQGMRDGGSEPVSDEVQNVVSVPDFVRTMLTQTRLEQPRPLTALEAGITDARFYRILLDSSRVGVHLRGQATASASAPPSAP